ncbi:MAG TPA: hypothetical protein VGJ97_12915, partial [Anaerolineaceae bacterium]
KAHRAEGLFEVRSLFLEDGVAEEGSLWADLAGALTACAAWHQTPRVALPERPPLGLFNAVEQANPVSG